MQIGNRTLSFEWCHFQRRPPNGGIECSDL